MKCAIKLTSPNQQGVEGTDWEEVWILTGKLAILFKSPPYSMGMFHSSLVRRHILRSFATCYDLVAQLVGLPGSRAFWLV